MVACGGVSFGDFVTWGELLPLNFEKTWNDAGETWTGLTLTIDDQGSDLASYLLKLSIGGLTEGEFLIDKRCHIYGSGNILKLGTQTDASDGNFNLSGSDLIARLENYGAGHGVYDILFARGTIDAPSPALMGDQMSAVAGRAFTSAGVWTTTWDITSGAAQNHDANSAGTDLVFWNVLNDTLNLRMAIEIKGSLGGLMNVYGPLSNITDIKDGINYISFLSSPTVEAGVTTNGPRHFVINDIGLGVGSSVTSTHTGVDAADFNVGANKISYRSRMIAGADKWAAFFDGGAQSYFEGSVGIGLNTPLAKLDINGTLRITDLLYFVGFTAAFPALKRSGTIIQGRLGDDTDFSTIQAKLMVDNVFDANPIVGTGSVIVYDGNGAAVRVSGELV